VFHPIELAGHRDLIAGGGCYVTGDTNNLVSTGVIIEGEGLLCLSRGVIHDLALAAGFDPQPKDLHDRLAAETKARKRAEDRVLYLERLIADMVEAVPDRVHDSPVAEEGRPKSGSRARK